jgi:hypothetical protein
MITSLIEAKNNIQLISQCEDITKINTEKWAWKYGLN